MQILLVEDNPADIRLTREALREGRFQNHLTIVTDGEEALDFLYGRGKFVRAPRPDLVLLDLNLPKKDGREVLQIVKNDPQLRRIPVIVLTTSKAERDVTGAYDQHANAFISKPLDFDAFVRVFSAIEGFWFDTARLPRT
ncbi:MAG TPA: response regulator [Candidatus Acidoferrales bacterium]|nr:response regulator [Candidatus Acidoferrales bacterium]